MFQPPVSIHAPARGATAHGVLLPSSHSRFQSTPPRGGRRGVSSGGKHRAGFNPRPRAGGDEEMAPALTTLMVSIHAPARGATSPTTPAKIPPKGFNPRPRAGGDRNAAYKLDGHTMFQSTPPRGGRLSAAATLGQAAYVSIHAPARGATANSHKESAIHLLAFNIFSGFSARGNTLDKDFSSQYNIN